MALTVKSLYDNGSVHGPEMLELTEDDIAVKFASGLSNLASFSLSISYPSIAAAPCMFNNAYKNVLALSLATDYTYKQAEKVEEFLKVSNSLIESTSIVEYEHFVFKMPPIYCSADSFCQNGYAITRTRPVFLKTASKYSITFHIAVCQYFALFFLAGNNY